MCVTVYSFFDAVTPQGARDNWQYGLVRLPDSNLAVCALRQKRKEYWYFVISTVSAGRRFLGLCTVYPTCAAASRDSHRALAA
jgi:hypothetical protein